MGHWKNQINPHGASHQSVVHSFFCSGQGFDSPSCLPFTRTAGGLGLNLRYIISRTRCPSGSGKPGLITRYVFVFPWLSGKLADGLPSYQPSREFTQVFYILFLVRGSIRLAALVLHAWVRWESIFLPRGHLGTDALDLSWRLFEKVIRRFPDICIMVAKEVVVLFLPFPCAPHEALREASGVVGSFLEWRCCCSLG